MTAYTPKRYIEHRTNIARLVVYRLLRCPTSGDWCTSQCSYDRHASVWRVIATSNSPTILLASLRDALVGRENKAIDVIAYPGKSHEGWVWIDRGENLDDDEAVDGFLSSLDELLTSGYRLRLYGDPEADDQGGAR